MLREHHILGEYHLYVDLYLGSRHMRFTSSNVSLIITDIQAWLNNKQENLKSICESMRNNQEQQMTTFSEKSLFEKYDHTLSDINKKTKKQWIT